MRYTLLADGSSDAVLRYILNWLIERHTTACFEPQWADLRKLPKVPKTLTERIRVAVSLYPCDLLFVHRDAERESREKRIAEIQQAVSDATSKPVVCVIPVRMQEAWLIFDEIAIRRAAGCPNGKMPLDLPDLSRIENEPDPKTLLHTLLRVASGYHGRRAKQFQPNVHTHRLGELITDFGPLRRLPAFQALESDLVHALRKIGCPALT